MKINIPTAFKLWSFPEAAPEHVFHPTRKWRFDYAWPKHHVAFEFEGGSWVGGAHTRGKGYAKDCLKYAEAAILGWIVIRGTTEMVSDGTAFDLLQRALESRGWRKAA